jgi:Xaa-Pro aminopeptidase
MTLEPFRARRAKLMKDMGEKSLAVLCTAPTRNRNNDVDYKFRPDSNFYYLTGFAEADAVAVLRPNHPEGETILFVLPKDPEKEVWNGRRAGVEEAKEKYGADLAYSIEELDQRLPKYLENVERLYYRVGKNEAFDTKMVGWIERLRAQVRAGISAPTQILDPASLVHEHRLFKSDLEIDLLHRAGDITCKAHLAAMRAARPDNHEYQVEAEVDCIFRREGGVGPGYPSIVASGANATILHYITNNRKMRAGDLMLLDAGCELDYYTADVTRTFPVSGKFSEPQRAIYEAVLEAQLAGIEKVKPGAKFQDIHDEATKVLTKNLVKLQILQGDPQDIIAKGQHRRFFMHRTSHWLGMDVHDCGSYYVSGASRQLEPGMVLTVEPGLYFAENDTSIDARWRGIGVRIEDDVLVTAMNGASGKTNANNGNGSGHRVLTQQIPKTVAEVESAVRG